MFPSLRSVVFDTTDVRGLAEFYRALLGYDYRPGDEVPPAGEPDDRGSDWLVLVAPGSGGRLAFQQVDHLAPATWPDDGIPQQVHLDLSVPDTAELAAHHERILSMGARLLADRSDDPDEPLYVYSDPSGHPFCVFVAP